MKTLPILSRVRKTLPVFLLLTAWLALIATPACATDIDLSTLALNGTATLVDSNTLRLVSNDNTNSAYTYANPPAGSAWSAVPVQVASGFTTTFTFLMSSPTGITDPYDGSGGDGLAFVIQNSASGTSALGRGAGGLGYMYIYNSLAVEFDTYENQAWYSDPDGNHISVQTRGTDFNVPHHKCSGGKLTNAVGAYTDLPDVTCTADPSLGSATVSSRLDGTEHTATIVYAPGTMTIYMDGSSVPILTVAVDLSQTLSLTDGTAYVGFTAGSLGSFQNHDILSWSYDPNVPEPSTWMLAGAALAALGLLRRRFVR
jgi:hypothetical protein